MKKQSYLIMLTLCVFSTALFARSTVSQGAVHQTSRTTGSDEVINPAITVVNINNMAYWIAKDGAGTTQGSPNGEQADYPIFTGGFIYEDGMLWGVKSNEYSAAEPVRVGGSTYAQGMKAGNVRYDADDNVIGSDDPTNEFVQIGALLTLQETHRTFMVILLQPQHLPKKFKM